MKENQKEMNPKSKKVILIVVILLIALVTGGLVWASRNFDFRQTSNGEVNINSGESSNSDELSEEEFYEKLSQEIKDGGSDEKEGQEDMLHGVESGDNYFEEDLFEEGYTEIFEDDTVLYSGEKIEEAVFEFEGIKVSNFKVNILDGSTQVTGEVENQSGKKVTSVTLSLELYNVDKELLHDYSMVLSDIEANGKRNVETIIGATFTGLENIYVEATELNIEE